MCHECDVRLRIWDDCGMIIIHPCAMCICVLVTPERSSNFFQIRIKAVNLSLCVRRARPFDLHFQWTIKCAIHAHKMIDECARVFDCTVTAHPGMQLDRAAVRLYVCFLTLCTAIDAANRTRTGMNLRHLMRFKVMRSERLGSFMFNVKFISLPRSPLSASLIDWPGLIHSHGLYLSLNSITSTIADRSEPHWNCD